MSTALRVAVIDLGTNSVKFHIGERDAAGRWQRVLDRAQVTRLGEGLRDAGEIAPAAWDRTLAAVCAMAAPARSISCTGASAAEGPARSRARRADARAQPAHGTAPHPPGAMRQAHTGHAPGRQLSTP